VPCQIEENGEYASKQLNIILTFLFMLDKGWYIVQHEYFRSCAANRSLYTLPHDDSTLRPRRTHGKSLDLFTHLHILVYQFYSARSSCRMSRQREILELRQHASSIHSFNGRIVCEKNRKVSCQLPPVPVVTQALFQGLQRNTEDRPRNLRHG